ncbi:MAG: bifunctional 5,10-methylenetetrahydrofolate dehydrogenase/5,10-methenyltetrahydrofolate cyclohydrolase [Candidatus Omnitrophica bacterium]|nr:bifunctional 5,10-methylenetetrahydrofolate dehydrogenase/5,10-methenyltetrahydrofolate cyclohydrolase [Candidatus Omnitrophota bacterium]
MNEISGVDKLYSSFKERLKTNLLLFEKLSLASVAVCDDFDCVSYRTQQKKIADELGVEYIPINISSDISFSAFQQRIFDLNHDPQINGIVINKPFPNAWGEEDVFSLIDPAKDIEGMTPYNLGRLLMGADAVVSPTVRSVLQFLNLAGISLRGKNILIVGASVLIGKPLSLILTNMFATVSLAHVATFNSGWLPFYVENSDIVISAVGVAQLIKADWLRNGAIVIDVGVGYKDGKMCGDVEYEKAKEKVAFITPVPGGVGMFTTLFLLDNLIKVVSENKGKKNE